MKKLAVLFPGIGYTCDKPLLYYSWKLLKALGWEVLPVSYTGFPSGVKGNPEKMRLCVQIALGQAEKALSGIRWKDCDRILFIGKSVGTVVGAVYAKQHGLRCRQILFTPVEDTFLYAGKESVAFHGTADPWVNTQIVRDSCGELNIPLFETEGANHSLETGYVEKDIGELIQVMKHVRVFITEEEK